MELTIEVIEQLLSLMDKHNLERLECQGLILQKGKEIKTMTLPMPEEKKISDTPKIIPNTPPWAKGKEHLMFANPFPEPCIEKDE